MASATDMVTDAMSALGMKTSDASKMVNQMANIEEKLRGDDFSNRIVDDICEYIKASCSNSYSFSRKNRYTYNYR